MSLGENPLVRMEKWTTGDYTGIAKFPNTYFSFNNAQA